MRKQLNTLLLLSLGLFITYANKEKEGDTNKHPIIKVHIPRSASEEFEYYLINKEENEEYTEQIDRMRKRSPKQSAAISYALYRQGIETPQAPKKRNNTNTK